MTEHHDYTGARLPRPEPASPYPKPLVQAGLPHVGACRYPAELGWVQEARKGWQPVLAAVGWTESARRWIFAVATVFLGGLVGLGLALGSSCRSAGAQEQRLTETDRDMDGLKVIVGDQAQRIREVDERQTERYERLLEITSRIDARMAVEEANRNRDTQHPSTATSPRR